jgi:hypothetical protein
VFEQTFKNIDDILHKDAGCTSELDYTEQSSWLLFLKYLDALEGDKANEAALEGKRYSFILDEAYRWESWAAPKAADGKFDHNAALTGDDLRDFVNNKLFPYLAGFKQRASGPNTIEYKIGEVFSEIKNKVQSGYNLRDVIELVDQLRFGSQTEKHELSHLYEAKIKNMGNAGRNGGEYYTPRPLIRAMIKVLDPKIGERIYDGACGSAGFLCEAFDYLLPQASKADDLKTLQTRTFYGKEKKSLAYVIAIMNMILHGIEAPNVIHANTLADNISDIQDKDRYDVILNSAGAALSQADFAMSKFAVNEQYGGNLLRKAIDYFCHLAVAPGFLSKIEKGDKAFVASEFFPKLQWMSDVNDDIYDPTYTDMLRVAFTSEFGRGKLQDLVALLSGRNFETKAYEEAVAEASFAKLKSGILAFMNKTHFDRITMILRSAGFVTSNLISSQNAVKRPAPAVESFASVWDALVNIATAMGREVHFELQAA